MEQGGCRHLFPNAKTSFDFLQDTVQFQFVLATDGGKTFAYTFYSDVNILFPPHGRKVAIGHAGGGDSQSSIFSYTDAAFRISQLQGNTFDCKYSMYNCLYGIRCNCDVLFKHYHSRFKKDAMMEVMLLFDHPSIIFKFELDPSDEIGLPYILSLCFEILTR